MWEPLSHGHSQYDIVTYAKIAIIHIPISVFIDVTLFGIVFSLYTLQDKLRDQIQVGQSDHLDLQLNSSELV